MKKICIICMRAGSTEVKNKNLKLINGKPLLYYTIDQAIKSKLFERIVVSTDSIKILNLSNKFGASGWFLRPKKYANNKISKIPSIIHAVKKAEKKYQEKYDIIFDLDVTSPLRSIKDIKNAYKKFKKDNASNLITGCSSRKNPYFNMFEYKNNQYQLVKNIRNFTSRQSAPKVYEMNASIYIWKRSYLFNKRKLFGKKTSVYFMPQERSIDIDSFFDFKIVKSLI